MTEEKQKIALEKSEEDTYESEKEVHEETDTPKSESKAAKSGNLQNKKTSQGKKQSVTDLIKGIFKREPKEEIPELWTGQTSVLDVIAPSSVDNGAVITLWWTVFITRISMWQATDTARETRRHGYRRLSKPEIISV